VEITGFSLAEVELVLEEARESSPDPEHGAEDAVAPITDPVSAVSSFGDLWLLDRHRLLCGDSRNLETFERLLGNERADLIFTDPPYNVPIDGHVCGLGRNPPSRVRHGGR